MFNLSPDKSRTPGHITSSANSYFSFGTSDPLGTSSEFPDHPQHNTATPSASNHMEWTPTPTGTQSHYHSTDSAGYDANQNALDYEALSPLQNVGGVGRLVAHFESKDYVPPLPPRPINNASSSIGTTSTMSSHFGSLNAATNPHINRAPSPVASPIDSHYGSFSALSRIASPSETSNMATSPSLISFGSFTDTRVQSPGVSSIASPFPGMGSFVPMARVSSPMGAGQLSTSVHEQTFAGVGTPGFEIWRAPDSAEIKQEPFPASSPAVNSHGFVKPPVPPKPKPMMSDQSSNQFILDFNSTTGTSNGASFADSANVSAKAKGKAPVKPPIKPPRPRLQPPPPPPPPRHNQAEESVSSPMIKQEPTTPQPFDMFSPFPAKTQRQSSVSSRSHLGSRSSREQVPAVAWEQYKGTIKSLYLEDRKPLKEVMSIMSEKYGFQATPKMYKTRFSQWGFVKNNTEEEVKRLLSMKFQRDAEGKVSEFVRNGRVVNIGTYLKRKGVTEYDLVDFELPSNDLPDYVRCRTPTPPPAPGYIRSPDLLRAQELVIGNMRKAFLQCRQVEVDTGAEVGWSVIQVWGAWSSDLLLEANFYFEAQDTDSGGQILMRAFKQLEEDLKKLSPQGINELLLGMVRRDFGLVTALCKYLAAHSTTNLERSHPLRQIFSCLYDVQQKHGSATLSELLWSSVPTIAEELEAIYGRRHPYVTRMWLDLAYFYDQINPDRFDKLVAELRSVQQQLEQRSGLTDPDVIVLRYAILQLMYASAPQSPATKQACSDLWHTLKGMEVVFPMRDPRPNAYCYHSPVRLDPWTKRCRRRYDCGLPMFEEHVGVKLHPYFEEEFHTTQHALDAGDSWANALDQMQQTSRWNYI